MEKDKKKKGLFGRLTEKKESKKSSCCCCNFEVEEIPEEEQDKNAIDEKNQGDKGNCCG